MFASCRQRASVFTRVATAIEKLNSRTLIGYIPGLFKAISTGLRI